MLCPKNVAAAQKITDFQNWGEIAPPCHSVRWPGRNFYLFILI